MRIFFSVGEPSGDQHAAHLMHALRAKSPDIEFCGFGGPEMQQAGLDCLYQLTDLAVMGIGKVLPLIGKFYSLYGKAKEYFRTQRPDAVVLVDFPGFNWWVASAAKSEGIPVLYYCAPQLWAWGAWRISKVRKYVDHILSTLPFEAEWYRERGVSVEYVGHPFFDEVAEQELDAATLLKLKGHHGRCVAILPGSRKQEVENNFPSMLAVIRELSAKHPDVRFAVACYKEWHEDRCRELISNGHEDLPIDLYTGKTSEVIEGADCCLMVSGSVSLELLARKTPAIVMYKGSILLWAIAHLLLTVKYMSLPNLIAGRDLMPEFPFAFNIKGEQQRIAQRLDEWLSNADVLQQRRDELSALADEIVQAGGVQQAAASILSYLNVAEPMRRAA
ncbi:MAG: lipid-A-disaccharide synthase [Planctomycetaceae bacterium]|nr:lipid-A-disaccharide synthase [Planctomycetaceae bacterium]MCB9953476.1 lipid-A-disaccharide synthase [Planctomycetaceae bacterium]